MGNIGCVVGREWFSPVVGFFHALETLKQPVTFTPIGATHPALPMTHDP